MGPPPEIVWSALPTDNAPSPRFSHTAVWTGSKMLVWGGFGAMNLEPAGGVYDPASDTWTPMSTQGQPSVRLAHTAVWTGSKMVVWGGANGPNVLGNGGIYDPAKDTWTEINAAGGPPPRRYHGVAWSGTTMMVWGGADAFDWLNNGAILDPAAGPTGVWVLSTNLVGAPIERELPTAAWTGKSFLVWGGWTGGAHTNTGGLFDPKSNAWTGTSAAGVPSARADHVGLWAGTHLFVWGGCAENMCSATNTLADGGQFVPSAEGGTWYPIKMQADLGARYGATGLYTGDGVIVWGGRFDPLTSTNTGAEAGF